MNKATYAAVLDTRYQKQNSDTYPVRMRITYNKVQKYYPTKFKLTQQQWDTMKGKRPGDLKDTLLEINAVEKKAAGIIEKMRKFSFDDFKKKFDRNSNDTGLITTAFDDYIKTLSKNDQVGTAISYTNAKNSIARFNPDLTFDDITPELLQQYEKWMLTKGYSPKKGNGEKKANSLTTVGIYLRSLRSLFNKAIAEGDIEQSAYPFGRRKHSIRKGAGRKIALREPEIKLLYDYPTDEGSALDKAKDFFFFMYLCDGINLKDVCLLKYKDINEGFLHYVREKTARTKIQQETGETYLLPEAIDIIKKWGNPKKPDNYIFPVISPGMTAVRARQKVRDFNSYLNRHLKILAKEAGIDKNITCYCARHTFAMVSMNGNIPLEMIRRKMRHTSIATTQNYFASGFDNEALIKSANILTGFKKTKTAKVVNL